LVVRSPQKLSKLLFEYWKCPVLKVNVSKKTVDEDGNPNETNSTDKEVLHELALDGWENAKHIHEYRQALNRVVKFADNPLKSVDYNADDRTHPQAFVFSTYTGRMTYASTQGRAGTKAERQIGFAIHQEKREKNFRDIVIAPPGYTLVEFDAAGQEYKWMAVRSKDEKMLELSQPGEDAHSYMGSRIIEMDYKEFRHRLKEGEERISGPRGARMGGKVGNLSLQYRTSAKRLLSTARTDYDLPWTMSQAERVHSVYPQTYTSVPVFWRSQIDLAKRQGYVETIAGRRVKLIGDWSDSFGWAMGSTAINYAIQGTGADQKYLALAVLKNHMRKYDVHFVLDMHDGLYFFVPDGLVNTVARVFQRALNSLPYQEAWGLKLPIPMTWDCKYGPSWGRMQEWKE
jgi:DNA polymerase-1